MPLRLCEATISVDALKHINIQMSTRRCQVLGNTCVISENLLHVYSHTEALYWVKWYANPVGTGLSASTRAPSHWHRCVHAVSRGIVCGSEAWLGGGWGSKIHSFITRRLQIICVMFVKYFASIIHTELRGGISGRSSGLSLTIFEDEYFWKISASASVNLE